MRSLQIFTIKKMGRCLVLCLLFLTAGMPGWAQLGLSPLGMDASYPLAAWSPAQKIDTGLVIALPTVYASAYHTGPSLWSTVQRERGRTFIDVNDWVGHLGDRNRLRTELDLQSLGVHWRIGRHQWGLHHRVRSEIELRYPRELAEVLAEGNAQFVGQNIDIGPGVHWQDFHEIGLGYSYHGDRWSAGLRVKRLQGIQHLETTSDRFELYTDPEFYQLRLRTDYRIRQAGILEIEDDFDAVLYRGGSLWENFSFRKNTGWALDLGGTFSPIDKLQLQVAMLDIGAIRWNRDSKIYSSNGEFSFEGISFDELADLDTIDLSEILDTDTLEEKLKFTEEATSFRSPLPHRLVASAGYQITERHRMTLSAVMRFSKQNGTDTGVALHWRANWLSWISTGLQYGNLNGERHMLGASLHFDFRYLRLFAWTDDILLLSQEDNAYFNMGLGASLHLH